jgi:hypothetical protein
MTKQEKLTEAAKLLVKAAELIEASGQWPGLALEVRDMADAVDVAAS